MVKSNIPIVRPRVRFPAFASFLTFWFSLQRLEVTFINSFGLIYSLQYVNPHSAIRLNLIPDYQLTLAYLKLKLARVIRLR